MGDFLKCKDAKNLMINKKKNNDESSLEFNTVEILNSLNSVSSIIFQTTIELGKNKNLSSSEVINGVIDRVNSSMKSEDNYSSFGIYYHYLKDEIKKKFEDVTTEKDYDKLFILSKKNYKDPIENEEYPVKSFDPSEQIKIKNTIKSLNLILEHLEEKRSKYQKINKNKPIEYEEYFKNYFNYNDLKNNVEGIVLALIMLSHLIIKDSSIDEEYKYEFAVIISKINKKINDNNNKEFSSSVKYDLNFNTQYYLKKINFDPLVLCEKYPKYLFISRFDSIFKTPKKPYNSQIEFLTKFCYYNTYGRVGCLFFLNTLTGEGKTSLIIPTLTMVQKLRDNGSDFFENENKFKSLEVIYCHNFKLKAIRNQVIEYAKIMNFNFALACKDTNNKINKLYVKGPGSEKDCILTIADISITGQILKEAEPGKQYVLYFDELTAFLDEGSSELLEELTSLLEYMPDNTVLASATLPSVQEMQQLINYYQNKYINNIPIMVTSSSAKIGCEIYNFYGKLYYPNKYADNLEKLKSVISVCKENAFVKKLYTPQVVAQIWEKIKNIDLKKYENSLELTIERDSNNFENIFMDPANISQQAIENVALIYLNILLEIGSLDELYYFNNLVLEKDSINLFDLKEYKKSRFPQQTLLITSNATNFINTYFEKEINEVIKDNNNASLSMILKKLNNINDPNKYKFQNRLFKISDYINMIDNFQISDEIKIAFLFGVGVYDPSSQNVSTEYTNLVIELAESGVLSYIISSTDISYGTNWKIENIIIDNTCFSGDNTHSINTLFQLFSRAGRVGKSWKATIYADSEIINLLNNFILFNTPLIESIRLNEAIQNIPINKNNQTGGYYNIFKPYSKSNYTNNYMDSTTFNPYSNDNTSDSD